MIIACVVLGAYVIMGIIAALKFRRVRTILTWPYELFLLWLVGRYM